jgi:hypothetical protein
MIDEKGPLAVAQERILSRALEARVALDDDAAAAVRHLATDR